MLTYILICGNITQAFAYAAGFSVSTDAAVVASCIVIPVTLVCGSGAEIAIIGGVSVVISLTVEVHPFADASEDGGRIVTMRRALI